MNLIEYEGKKVRFIYREKIVWEGNVSEFIYPEDNEPEEIESIIMICKVGRFPGRSIEFTAPEIESIKVLE